jgi:hypothetical protein
MCGEPIRRFRRLSVNPASRMTDWLYQGEPQPSREPDMDLRNLENFDFPPAKDGKKAGLGREER